VQLGAGSDTVTPPALTSLSPNTATASGAAFTLTVNGSNFVSGATVIWNGAARTTTFVSATQVTAAIPASDIAAAGTAQVTAINPGSASSNALPFTVNPVPVQTYPLTVTRTGTAATRGTGTCTVTMNAAKNVTATINRR
jgi:hypothetical protein